MTFFSYIKMLTKMRREAKSKVEKTWYKLLVNALFGKFLQNNEKYTVAKIHRTRESLLKSLHSPYFKSLLAIDDDDFVITFERQKIIKVNKPHLIGVILSRRLIV